MASVPAHSFVAGIKTLSRLSRIRRSGKRGNISWLVSHVDQTLVESKSETPTAGRLYNLRQQSRFSSLMARNDGQTLHAPRQRRAIVFIVDAELDLCLGSVSIETLE